MLSVYRKDNKMKTCQRFKGKKVKFPVQGKRGWLLILLCACAIGIYGCATMSVKLSTSEPVEEWKLTTPLVVAQGVGLPETLHYVMNIKAYKDPDKDLSSYKTFTFDYTDKKNPLLEKELFKMVETALTEGIYSKGRGLRRSEDNPDILITMNFYTGRKEEYTPPETVVTTRVGGGWTSGFIGQSWYGGYEPVPITESYTKPGYTKVSYYRNIRLNFLDYSELTSGKKLKTPPLIWIGEVESEGYSSDIRAVAPVLLTMLLGEFPVKTGEKIQKVHHTTYGSIGIKVDADDSRLIREVLPGSPAEKAGLKEGNIILKVDGKVLKGPAKLVPNPYSSGVLGNLRGKEVEFEVWCPTSKTKRKVRLIPEKQTRLWWYEKDILSQFFKIIYK